MLQTISTKTIMNSCMSACKRIPVKRVAAFLGTEVSSYQTPVSNLMKAIAAVIALVGAFSIYFKMQNGDQDVKKAIMLTIGGCVAFLAMSEALPLFFK